MHDNDDLENLTPDSIKKKDKHKELLDKVYKLEDMNDYSMISDGSFLPSSLLKEQNKKEDNGKNNSGLDKYKIGGKEE